MRLFYTPNARISALHYLEKYEGERAEGRAGVYYQRPAGLPTAISDLGKRVTTQLNEYFSGHRTRFDLPIELKGTPFQLKVWRALLGVQYGERLSYSALAEMAGARAAVRAAAKAVADNLFPIIVPCHRVVYKSGNRQRYAVRTLKTRGEVVKLALLDMEKRYAQRAPAL